MRERRSKEEWKRLVSTWRRSGRSASSFAAENGVLEHTLRWWAWRLGYGTRAKRELSAPRPARPIEIDVAASRPTGGSIELVLAQGTLRIEPGTDVSYVARLVGALVERS